MSSRMQNSVENIVWHITPNVLAWNALDEIYRHFTLNYETEKIYG